MNLQNQRKFAIQVHQHHPINLNNFNSIPSFFLCLIEPFICTGNHLFICNAVLFKFCSMIFIVNKDICPGNPNTLTYGFKNRVHERIEII